MIKNTFEIIKKNKMIPILFGAMFAYITLYRLLDSQIYYVFYPLIDLVDDLFNSWHLGYDIVKYIIHAIGAAFLLSPAMHCIYLAVTGEKTDGFYKAGLKRNWYKAVLVVLAVLILWDIAELIRFSGDIYSMFMGFYAQMFLIYIIGMALVIFMLLLLVSVSYEKKLGAGIKNVFKSGKKYLLISAASVIVLWLLNRLYNVNFYSDVSHTIFVILVMMLQAAIIMFILTLGMNEYARLSMNQADVSSDEAVGEKRRGKLSRLTVNTIRTLKKYPKIFLWYLIPFAYQAIRVILIRFDILSSKRTADAIQSLFYGGTMPGGKEYLTWLSGFSYSGVMMFLIYPPLIYLIYLLADNKSIKNWYKDGLKLNWWKVFVFRLIMASVMIAVVVVLGLVMILGMSSVFAYNGFAAVIFMFITLIILSVIGVYMSAGEVTVIGEKNFGDGLKMMVKSGKKHFFRILLVLVVLGAVYFAFSIPMYMNPELLNGIWAILASLVSSLTAPVILAFCMNCYIDVRDKEMEKSTPEIKSAEDEE